MVVGGGHNGLACATYLARAGRSVLVLEAAGRLGGAAATREFAPGFRVSAGAHLLHQMPARLIAELQLEQHGLRWAAQSLPTVALAADAAPLIMDGDSLDGEVDAADREAYRQFRSQLGRFAAALQPLLDSMPPRLGTDRWSDRLSLLGLGWRIRRLGRRDMRELLRIAGMNAHDLLTEHFKSPLLQGAFGLDAVLGTNFGPRAPGTVMTLLYRLALQHGAGARGLSLPVGGLGAVSDSLAAAARAAGVQIRLASPVARVTVADDRASGVTLQSGESIAAATVISSADPKNSLLGLLGAEHLDTSFVRRVHHLRTSGLAAKLHLALDGPPQFRALPAAAHGARLLIAPTLDYVERAFNHSKYGEYSRAPALELTLPTISDASLAGAGKHVLSAIVHYAPYELRGGWEGQRQAFTASIIELLEQYAPGLRGLVRHSELLVPPDIEREFRIHGGHWHHADLALDQFFAVRPVPGATQHRTPLAGYFLCGAGCHPGGGV
ncbi:MAG: NAD(P)/FAD-dependent oxidoreductase, partial [Proteobacteria bacterium]|nr:NAD(P)/FAD-dependent oxidoreductase [Pseudomonadota bacterium]